MRCNYQVCLQYILHSWFHLCFDLKNSWLNFSNIFTNSWLISAWDFRCNLIDRLKTLYLARENTLFCKWVTYKLSTILSLFQNFLYLKHTLSSLAYRWHQVIVTLVAFCNAIMFMAHIFFSWWTKFLFFTSQLLFR